MDSSLVFHLSNGVLMVAIPLSLAFILRRRWKLGWRILLVGAATFILSQVGHIPFNALMTWLFSKTALVNLSAQGALIFNAGFPRSQRGLFRGVFPLRDVPLVAQGCAYLAKRHSCRCWARRG